MRPSAFISRRNARFHQPRAPSWCSPSSTPRSAYCGFRRNGREFSETSAHLEAQQRARKATCPITCTSSCSSPAGRRGCSRCVAGGQPRRVGRSCARRDAQRIAGEAILREKDQELERLRADAARQRQSAKEGYQRLDVMSERLMRLEATAQGAAARSEAAQAGAERVEGHLLGFTRRIANPQSRGVFGEEALRNQVALLGLRENRDFRRQVKGHRKRARIDYAVSLRDHDRPRSEVALDPDLDGISGALAAGDDGDPRTHASSSRARSSPPRSTGPISSAARRSC